MTTIPTSWAGFDRANPIGSAWDALLYAQSNFVFQGAYIAHGPHENRRDWFRRDAYPTLKQTGWGWCLFFLGYSVYGDGQTFLRLPSNLTPDQLTAQAVQDAQRIKTMCHDLDPDLAGCVVIFDNEDHADQQGDWARHRYIIPYYTRLLEEMMTPGPGNVPAVRAGFYSHVSQASQLLVQVPDLFLWIAQPIKRKHPRTGALLPPFTENATTRRVDLNLDWMTISIVQTQRNPITGSPPFGAIPLGRQSYFWKQQNMPSRALGRLTPIRDWDFDISLARDPRYPHGEPRFSVSRNMIVRGNFRKTDNTMVPTATGLATGVGAAPTVIGGLTLEPEAPLVLLPNFELYSLSNRSQIVTARRGNDGHWTASGALPAGAPLRRLRVLNAQLLGTDVYLFYVSSAFQLVTRRRTGGSRPVWGAETVLQVQAAQGLHQLTNIAACISTGGADVFFINTQGLLSKTAPLLPHAGAYPAQNSQILEPGPRPTLLLGTALATASPSPSHVLVFGVGRDLRLHAAVWRQSAGWGPLLPVGGVGERLAAHSRLAVLVPARNRTTVLVGAVSDQNQPCLYRFLLGGDGAWHAATPPRQLYPQLVVPAPPGWRDPNPGGQLEPSFGYAVNPFGDVAVLEDTQGVVLAVTGVSNAGGAVLVRHVDRAGPWQCVR